MYLIINDGLIKYALTKAPVYVGSSGLDFVDFVDLTLRPDNSQIVDYQGDISSDFVGCKYRYVDGSIVLNPDYVEPIEQIEHIIDTIDPAEVRRAEILQELVQNDAKFTIRTQRELALGNTETLAYVQGLDNQAAALRAELAALSAG